MNFPKSRALYHPQPLFFTQPSDTPFPFGDMHVHPPKKHPFVGLNLKAGKMNYRVGNLDPIRAKWLECELF